MTTNLIGISGKIGSGKDTVSTIIQFLVEYDRISKEDYISNQNLYQEYLDFLRIGTNNEELSFQIKKFADGLKDMICLMLNCTREQLEDSIFKNTELPEEWWYYRVKTARGSSETVLLPRWHYKDDKDNQICEERFLVKPTPRLLLQLMGTECLRDIIHPNCHVNMLFSQYVGNNVFTATEEDGMSGTQELVYPNWIVTDMRFPNEMKAIKDKGGITIRIERNVDSEGRPIIRTDEHPSETSLDNAGFDEIIDNNCSMGVLINLVREMLIKYEILR